MIREIVKAPMYGVVVLLAVGAIPRVHAQDSGDSLLALAFNEFDTGRRIELLLGVVDPAAGPSRGAWPRGVQLLAQTLIEDGRDSLAAVWLRWAIRLAPDMEPDSVQFLPKVIMAFRSARDFVVRTRGPADSIAVTTWLWPRGKSTETEGQLRIATSGSSPVRVDVGGAGRIGAGGSVPLRPGSYPLSAASGSNRGRVTREVLPGVTTVLEFRFQDGGGRKRGGIPLWAKVGAGGVVVWTILWHAYIKSH